VVLTLDKLSQNDIDKVHLVRIFDRPMEVEHGYHLVSLDGAQRDPSVVAFKRWLIEEVSL